MRSNGRREHHLQTSPRCAKATAYIARQAASSWPRQGYRHRQAGQRTERRHGGTYAARIARCRPALASCVDIRRSTHAGRMRSRIGSDLPRPRNVQSATDHLAVAGRQVGTLRYARPDHCKHCSTASYTPQDTSRGRSGRTRIVVVARCHDEHGASSSRIGIRATAGNREQWR